MIFNKKSSLYAFGGYHDGKALVQSVKYFSIFVSIIQLIIQMNAI